MNAAQSSHHSPKRARKAKAQECWYCHRTDHTSISDCYDYYKSQPIPEVIIERSSLQHCWVMLQGSHKLPLYDSAGKPFADYADPMDVAKYLATRANGEIRVLVNL